MTPPDDVGSNVTWPVFQKKVSFRIMIFYSYWHEYNITVVTVGKWIVIYTVRCSSPSVRLLSHWRLRQFLNWKLVSAKQLRNTLMTDWQTSKLITKNKVTLNPSVSEIFLRISDKICKKMDIAVNGDGARSSVGKCIPLKTFNVKESHALNTFVRCPKIWLILALAIKAIEFMLDYNRRT